MPVYNYGEKWRVRVWWRGKRQDWILRGTKRDAEAFEARTRAALERGAAAPVRVVPTFCDFVKTHYLPHASKRLKASTLRNRKYQVATLLQHFHARRLNEIRPADVESFQDARLAAGVAPSTINDETKVLRRIINYARGRELPLAPLRFQRLRQRTRRHAEPFSADEVARLQLAAAEHAPELVPLLAFLVNTGARKGEAIALRWEHVDLERGLVRIWPSEEWQPKDGKAREIPISPALRPWLERPHISEAVFPNRSRKPYRTWPQRLFERARAHAGLTGGPHRLRHTFATHFLAAIPDLYLLARLLGHSHTRVTELYAHLLPDHLERARTAVSFAAPVTPELLEATVRSRLSARARANQQGRQRA